jgi:drug/metabolite transporter (DMT)-like permease
VIATVATGAVVTVRDSSLFRIGFKDLKLLMVYGVIGIALNYLGYFYALKFVPVATAITLLYTYPAIVVLFGRIILHEPITHGKLYALALTFFGIVLSACSQPVAGLVWDPRGLAFGLLASIANAVYTLVGKRAQTMFPLLTSLFYSFLFGSLALLAFRFVVIGLALRLNLQLTLLILAIAFVPTLIAYGAYGCSLRYIEAGKASVTSSTELVFATVLAFLILGEIPNSLQLLGSALILSGVVTLQLKWKT